MKPGQFLRHYFRSPMKTVAVATSSRQLAERIIGMADLSGARMVIELGPGTGVFTERILAALPPACEFFALEINADFVAATRRRCPGARVHHDTAARANHYLRALGRTGCDRIISGLPWASFAASLQDELLGTIVEALEPGGLFLTFAYLQGLLLPTGQRFRRKLSARFASIQRSHTVWRNVPPAFVYCARR